MKQVQLHEMPRVVSAYETRNSVVSLARFGHGPRRIANLLGIDEADVTGHLLGYAERRYRQGWERGRESGMPNLPTTGRAA